MCFLAKGLVCALGRAATRARPLPLAGLGLGQMEQTEPWSVMYSLREDRRTPGAEGHRQPHQPVLHPPGEAGGGECSEPGVGGRIMAWLRRPQSHFWIRNANFAYSGSARPGEANASRWALPPLAHVYSLGLKHSV